MNAQILKNMVVDGRLLQSGDIIDVKGWKHAKALNRSRYSKILDEVVKPKAEPKAEPKVQAVEKPKAKKAVASK